MNQSFNVFKISRTLYANYLNNYSLEQLNNIPKGFNNNLIWNIVHIIVTQQQLVYKLSGLPMMVSDTLVDQYRNGTKPERDITSQELEEIRTLLNTTCDQTKEDYEKGTFTSFKEYPTSTGFILKNIEDAIAFNNFHEAMHLGIMTSIKKFI